MLILYMIIVKKKSRMNRWSISVEWFKSRLWHLFKTKYNNNERYIPLQVIQLMVNRIEIDSRIYMYWVEIDTDNKNLSSDQNNENKTPYTQPYTCYRIICFDLGYCSSSTLSLIDLL